MSTTRKAYQLRPPKSDHSAFEDALQGIDWSNCLTGASVEEVSKFFSSTIQSAGNRLLQKAKVKLNQ